MRAALIKSFIANGAIGIELSFGIIDDSSYYFLGVACTKAGGTCTAD